MSVIPSRDGLRRLVLLYRRHEEWARRSGFAPMEWSDFKRTRLAEHGAQFAVALAKAGQADTGSTT